ncbi:type VII secretion system-associated protein [Nocardia sp. NPDC050193]
MKPNPRPVRVRNWFVLLDPTWDEKSSPATSRERIVGWWHIGGRGELGPFLPNPAYIPADASVPSDPLDALLRSAGPRGDFGDELIAMVEHTVVEVGCTDHDEPVVVRDPDGMDCLVVVTAAVQKKNLAIPRWLPIVGSDLPRFVPPRTDILFNPGGIAAFRLRADSLRGGSSAPR